MSDTEIEGSVAVGKGKAPKLPKMAKVKNKAPAGLQITAEQLLREAKERQLEIVPAPPKVSLTEENDFVQLIFNIHSKRISSQSFSWASQGFLIIP